MKCLVFWEIHTKAFPVAIDEIWFQNFWSPGVDRQYDSGMILRSFYFIIRMNFLRIGLSECHILLKSLFPPINLPTKLREFVRWKYLSHMRKFPNPGRAVKRNPSLYLGKHQLPDKTIKKKVCNESVVLLFNEPEHKWFLQLKYWRERDSRRQNSPMFLSKVK